MLPVSSATRTCGVLAPQLVQEPQPVLGPDVDVQQHERDLAVGQRVAGRLHERAASSTRCPSSSRLTRQRSRIAGGVVDHENGLRGAHAPGESSGRNRDSRRGRLPIESETRKQTPRLTPRATASASPSGDARERAAAVAAVPPPRVAEFQRAIDPLARA